MLMKKFKVSEDVLATIISYLQSRPFKEVEQLMLILPRDIELLGEEEVIRPFPSTPLEPQKGTVPSKKVSNSTEKETKKTPKKIQKKK